MEPHIKLAYRVGDPARPVMAWLCESAPMSSDWVFAHGFSPRGAYDRWKEERERLRRERDAARRQRIAWNRRRVYGP